MQMVDRQGNVHDVPDDAVPQAYAGGQLGFVHGSTVPFVLPDGKVARVHSTDAAAAFQQGARIATADEEQAAYVKEKQAGALPTTMATLAGVNRGLTLGLSDPIQVGLARVFGGKAEAEATRQELAEMKEAHPVASGAGEIAGAVLPSLIPGGAEAEAATLGARGAAEGVSAARELAAAPGLARWGDLAASALPARGVTRIGEMAERATAGLIDTGSGRFAARFAQKTLQKGAAGAAEGALFSVGNEVSEDTLGDHKLNGEKLLAAAVHGALVGGVAGGLGGALGETGRAVMGKVGPKIAEVAEQQAVRSLNPTVKFTRRMSEMTGGVEGVGRELLDRGLLRAGDNLEAIAPRLEAEVKTAGARIGGMMEQLDASAAKVRPDASRIVAAVEKDVIAPLEKLPGYEGVVSGVRSYLDSFASKTGGESMGFAQLHGMRAAMDDLIYRSAGSPTPIVKELRAARAVMEGELERSVKEAGHELGGSLLDGYKEAKLSYARLRVANEAAQDAVKRGVANRIISPSDYIMGAAGMVGGHVAGGPLGMLSGAAVGAAHHVVRERGNATAAVVLDKLAALGGVRRAALAIDTKVAEGVDGFFAGGEIRPKLRFKTYEGGRQSEKDEFESRRAALASASSSPYRTNQRTAEMTAALAPHAPKTAEAFSSAATAATAFLASKLPPAPVHEALIQHRPQVSDADRSAFLRYARAVDDPTSVLADMKAGTLTREQVEAVKTVYPELYGEVRTRVMRDLATKGDSLSYAQRLQLGTLLDLPTDETLERGFIQRMQQSYQQQAAAPTPKPGGAGGPPLQSIQQMSTSIESAGRK